MLAAALAVAATSVAKEKEKKPAAKADEQGMCYGVVGKGEGECGGKDPSTGNSWSCSGQNPTADLGWKKMTRAECDKTPKHKEAKAKRFEPNPA